MLIYFDSQALDPTDDWTGPDLCPLTLYRRLEVLLVQEKERLGQKSQRLPTWHGAIPELP